LREGNSNSGDFSALRPSSEINGQLLAAAHQGRPEKEFFFFLFAEFLLFLGFLHIIQIDDVAMDVFLCDVATIVGFVPCVLCDSYSVPSEYKCGA